MSDLAANLKDIWACGAKDQRPVKIFASLQTPGFGEFIAYLFYVNSVAAQFDSAEVVLIYRNDPPFKRDLVRLLPTKMLVEVPAHQALPPLDILSHRRPVAGDALKGWYDGGNAQQDIVITEGMATEYGLLGFEHHGYLRIPDEAVAGCTEELAKRGVDPNRWFCTIHAREKGFSTAAVKSYRNADLKTTYAAIAHIIQDLGGQVVRLGHPEMTPFPPMDGLIQLGLEPNTTFLQAFAVSRSRFFVCGPSGPLAFGDAFHVPMAYVNAWGWDTPNDRALIRTFDLKMPNGTILNQKDLVEYFCSTPVDMTALLQNGFKLIRVSAKEMCRVINQVYEATSDTAGWRTPDAPRTGPRPNQLVWPGDRRPRGTFIAMPSEGA